MSNEVKKNVNPRRTVTGEVRLAYVNAFKPRAQAVDEEKKDEDAKKFYSVCVLVDKKDKKTIDKINGIIDEAMKDGEALLKSKATGKVNKASLDISFRDGDTKAEEHPEFAGHMYFNCKSKMKPGTFFNNNGSVDEILDPLELYSGVYAKVSVTAYAYKNNANKGVAFALNAIMKTRDCEEEERFTSNVSAVSEFEESLEEDDDVDNML